MNVLHTDSRHVAQAVDGDRTIWCFFRTGWALVFVDSFEGALRASRSATAATFSFADDVADLSDLLRTDFETETEKIDARAHPSIKLIFTNKAVPFSEGTETWLARTGLAWTPDVYR